MIFDLSIKIFSVIQSSCARNNDWSDTSSEEASLGSVRALEQSRKPIYFWYFRKFTYNRIVATSRRFNSSNNGAYLFALQFAYALPFSSIEPSQYVLFCQGNSFTFRNTMDILAFASTMAFASSHAFSRFGFASYTENGKFSTYDKCTNVLCRRIVANEFINAPNCNAWHTYERRSPMLHVGAVQTRR